MVRECYIVTLILVINHRPPHSQHGVLYFDHNNFGEYINRLFILEVRIYSMFNLFVG